jgi:hypothetical protein
MMTRACLRAQAGREGIMANPERWTWGLTELLIVVTQFLTGIGLLLAASGLRTFGKWQREKIEERRIDLALEALAIGYESKEIFGRIRSVVTYHGEGTDVPPKPGESDEERKQRERFCRVEPHSGAR